eukprot:2832939-Prymnesium_polylepis.1
MASSSSPTPAGCGQQSALAAPRRTSSSKRSMRAGGRSVTWASPPPISTAAMPRSDSAGLARRSRS